LIGHIKIDCYFYSPTNQSADRHIYSHYLPGQNPKVGTPLLFGHMKIKCSVYSFMDKASERHILASYGRSPLLNFNILSQIGCNYLGLGQNGVLSAKINYIFG
jgi:hypothetical protein